MSVSVTLQKSMARSLDAVSSVMQHIVMIAGLFFLLGVVGFVFKGPEENSSLKAASSASNAVAAESVPAGNVLDVSFMTPAGDNAAVSPKPHFVGVLDYVKRRYRVSPEAVQPVFEVAELIGRERRIDPLLILAIIGVESGFNPFAESSMGARGLMQVIPRFHMDKVPEGMGVHHLFDPAVNIQVGVRVLEEAIRRRGGLIAGLQYYAGSSSSAGSYANKVLAEKARLEKAASR
ncbi:MAG: transglycosylase SLT domain-containing protein [Candidatus Accumulibacter sp.]|jgi:soluble lytic murein transglycosylase-like protein|nr:transglycosylase SLT domain-containing protein [Accumulibacter sp.]